MSGKYMAVKRIVVPTLTMLIIASQLMGCSVATKSEIQEMLSVSQEIEIEVATPISVEQGEKQSLTWIRLDQLDTYEDFRKQMDDIMLITKSANGSKNGIAYIGLDGQQEGNNTLYNAMMNRKFTANFLDDMSAQMELSILAQKLYVDATEENSLYAAVNAYWNLLPDATPNFFNGDGTLSRLEAMALIARANTQVTDNVGDDDFAEAFSDISNYEEYIDFASLVANDSYLSLGNKSLNNTTAVGTITRGEYIYMLIHNIFGEDRIASTDIKRASFNDTKSAGDIASQQKLNPEDVSKDYYESYELQYTMNNPEGGCPDRMYQALATAQELKIIGSDADWDLGLTKTEAIQLYMETLQAYTRENGYPVDQVNGNSITETETSDDLLSDMEIDEETLEQIIGVPEEEVIANIADETDTIEEEASSQIIPMEDTTMYCTSNKANIRAGVGTQYDTVGSLTYAQEVTINGKVEEADKLWYVIKTTDGSTQMVSGSLLSTTKPQPQQNTGSTGNTNQQTTTTQTPQIEQPQTDPNEPTERPDNAGQDWLDSMFGSDYGHDMNGASGTPSGEDWGINWQ